MVKPFYVKTDDPDEIEFIYNKSIEAGASPCDEPGVYFIELLVSKMQDIAFPEPIGFGVDGEGDTVVVHEGTTLKIDLVNDAIDISEVEEFLGVK